MDRGLSRCAERSRQEIAQELGVSRERARQLEAVALAKLRRKAQPLRSALEEDPCSPTWLP